MVHDNHVTLSLVNPDDECHLEIIVCTSDNRQRGSSTVRDIDCLPLHLFVFIVTNPLIVLLRALSSNEGEVGAAVFVLQSAPLSFAYVL